MIKNFFKEHNISIFGTVDYRSEFLCLESRKKIDFAPVSILVCAVPYHTPSNSPRNISRYACVNDYHRVLGALMDELTQQLKKSYPENHFLPLIDASPVNEIAVAAAAGLGKLGENGLLITEKYGSYIFLATLLTDLKLESTEQPVQKCQGCMKCQSSCPCGLKKELCLSALTQKKAITFEESQMISRHNLAWGCDICQEVCPENQNVLPCDFAPFKENIIRSVDKKSAEDLCKTRAFGFRGSGVILRNLELLNPAND